MSSPRSALVFKAGANAYRSIREHGFSPANIGTLAGASGGAKWLVLSRMDRVVVARIVPRLRRPVHLLGSSIGAWRFACYAQREPLKALDRFESAYLEQTYSDKPDVAEITEKSRQILDVLLGDDGAAEILAHPVLRTNILAVRARHLTATDRRPVLATGLLLAMAINTLNRQALGAFFSRGLFYDTRSRPPFFEAAGFPMERIPLTPDNLAEAVIASGSIPMVLAGVRNIPGAPVGTYRDGGVIDYHLDLPTANEDELTLYLHFFDWLKPGWFDKQLSWRGVDPANFERTLLVCPSREFTASLPGGKVPDRRDFVRLPPAERMARWREVVQRCDELADELNDVLERDELAARLQPL